jgi:hypothetical protein
MGGKVIFMQPCILQQQFSIRSKQECMKVTLPPMA